MPQIVNLTNNAGDFSEYTAVVDVEGDLLITAPGLANSSYKIECIIDNTTAMYAELGPIPALAAATTYRIRQYIDTNTLTIGTFGHFTRAFQLNSPSLAFEFQLRFLTGGLNYRSVLFLDSGSDIHDDVIAPGEHYVEVEVVRATSAVASDGTHSLFVDGMLIGQNTGLDLFDLAAPNELFVGPAFVHPSVSGTFFLDELVIRDDGIEIGERLLPEVPSLGRKDRLITVSSADTADKVVGRLVPTAVRWRGASSAGHSCVITDTAGKVLWSGLANNSNYVAESKFSNKWNDGITGLRVPTLDSGSLDIYYHI